jgi:hypothetical protein
VSSPRIRLTRIIAFNWYGFRTIIDVDGLTLLCGETGTGKSALLDLIQFVLSAGAAKFNKAAAGESNARDLVGYCLGDTNTTRKDGQARYLRQSGATIAALEFSWPAADGKEPRRETWGIRVQYESPTSQPSYVRFYVPSRMERADLCDDKGALLGEELFRSRVKRELGGDAGFTSHKAFQEEMGVSRHLHFDDEQMRKTLPKAIAFELDSDYQTFIREFILEANPPDVTSTRRSLGALRDAEKRVSQLRDQQQKLEQIAMENKSYEDAAKEAALFGYLRYAFDHAEAEENHSRAKSTLQAFLAQHAENLKKMEAAVAAQITARKGVDAVKLLAGKDDPKFTDFERLTRERDELKAEVARLTATSKATATFLTGRAQAWNRWLRDAATRGWPAEVAAGQLAILKDADVSRALDGVNLLVGEFNRIWQETWERLRPKENEITGLKEKQARLQGHLNQLRGGRTAATPLLDKLRSGGTKAITLARVVEVTQAGERWWGAIEALLGEDRNAVLVESNQDFLTAQGIWQKIQRSEPLIHPNEIPTQNPVAGSLATFLETSHPVARRFLDWKLGRIIAVTEPGALAANSHAATPDGAVHEAPVFRQITPEKDFTLGEEGLRRMRTAKQAEYDDVSRNLKELEQERDDVHAWLSRGKDQRLDQNDLPAGSADIRRLPECRTSLRQTEEAIALIETPALKDRLEKLHQLESDLTSANQTIGGLKGPITEFKIKQDKVEEEINLAKQEAEATGLSLKEARTKLPPSILDAEISARLEVAEKEPTSWKQRRSQAEGAAQNWQSQANEALSRRLVQRNALLTAHADEFSAFDVGDKDNARFDQRLQEIREHEVNRYERIAAERRVEWERRLQEDVLDRLRERLKDAKQTVADFQRILRREIGGYRYVLSQTRDPVHRAMWRLLDQSDDSLQAGDPLLDGRLKEEIESAKEELKTAIDHPEDKRAVALLDYRTYNHYDFEMVPAGHPDNSEGRISLQSKGRNLSGGEGQAPFFVAMLAAFYRVYDRGQRDQPANLGLVVMDEAFSKLSAGHIGDCLALAEGFGLQLILAFPMDRLGTMVQHADSIIQCRVQRRADAKGAPISIINDVIYWQRDRALAEFVS